MKNILKKLTCIALAFSSLVCSIKTSNAAISSKAEYGILVDQATGNVMYSKNAYEKAYPASTTKLMTAILYYEKFQNDLNKKVTVTDEMMKKVPSGSSTMLLEKDEVVTREQLLYGLMLVSGNDAAIVMAYDYSGSIEGFVTQMNKKAQEFGMYSTNFANPHGFHDENHYTTASDFAVLTREYMKYDGLRKISSTSKYAMGATNKKEAYNMFNSNRLISAKPEYKDYVYEKATGLKTGFTNKAKNCFVGTATNGYTGLIWVGFGYESTEQRFTESKKIFEYAFENFTSINVYEHIKDTGLYVDATSFNIPQYEYGSVDTIVHINAQEMIQVDNGVAMNLQNSNIYTMFRPLLNVQYPIKDGDFIGYIEYYSNNNLIYTAKAYSTKYLEDRQIPELFNTAKLNKEKGYGKKSFLEQVISLGMERKESLNMENTQDIDISIENKTDSKTQKTTTKITDSSSRS